jgi:hypothetical protein
VLHRAEGRVLKRAVTSSTDLSTLDAGIESASEIR